MEKLLFVSRIKVFPKKKNDCVVGRWAYTPLKHFLQKKKTLFFPNSSPSTRLGKKKFVYFDKKVHWGGLLREKVG